MPNISMHGLCREQETILSEALIDAQKTPVNPCLRVNRFCNFAIRILLFSRSRPIQPLLPILYPSQLILIPTTHPSLPL